MLEIIIKDIRADKDNTYKDVTIKTDTVEVYLGMFNKSESAKLAHIFETASDEMIE